MSSIIKDEGKNYIYVKGASEIVLEGCDKM